MVVGIAGEDPDYFKTCFSQAGFPGEDCKTQLKTVLGTPSPKFTHRPEAEGLEDSRVEGHNPLLAMFSTAAPYGNSILSF